MRQLSDGEAEKKFELLGGVTSWSEERFVEVYDLIFTTMSEVAKIKESGRIGDAEIAMSKWVDPSRVFGVVVMRKSAFTRDLIEAAHRALERAGEKVAIVIDDYPTQIYVLPERQVFIRKGSLESDLKLVELEK